MPLPTLKPRLVLIEDDLGRIEHFARWLTGSEFVLVTARSGGQALGLLRHGAQGMAGLMLDHDLSNAPLTAADATLSTSDLMPLIQRTVPRCVPVLIHSHSISKPKAMERTLQQVGFSVTRVRFALLQSAPALFSRWLDDVRDAWESVQP